jgi:hypothetical protein
MFLKNFDKNFESLINKISSFTNYESTIIVNGDHGMSKIEFHLDVDKYINSNYQINTSKIECFYDSTLARFWSDDVDVLKNLKKDPVLNSQGSFIYEDSSKKFKKLYGDVIWCINDGGLIYPNFFQKSLVKGMHGYIPSDVQHFGTLLLIRPCGSYPETNHIRLVDVNSILINEIQQRYKD